MKRLHIVPGESAGGSLLQAVRATSPNDEVLSFTDDLSSGPIDPASPSARAAWWAQWYDHAGVATMISQFWDRVETSEARLVVWFGRHSASELSFFHAWCDSIGERPFDIIDITGRTVTSRKRDGSVVYYSATKLGWIQSEALSTLIGSEQPITDQEIRRGREAWRELREENAPFRVVTDTGLRSAPINHFDSTLLEAATGTSVSMNRLVADVLGRIDDRYDQVGDVMLRARVLSLANERRLIVDGDQWTGRVRRPD